MKPLWIGLCAALAAGAPALAQSANERAGALKQWREQCLDPDIELRKAYVEQAIDEGDASVMRICVRQSLESDDVDVRNLGLRAAIASAGTIDFEVEMPKELAAGIAKAGDDERKMAEVGRWFISRDWNVLQSGLAFEVSDASVGGKVSVWHPLANLAKANDNYVGKTTVTGDRVSWTGSAYLSREACRLNAHLEPGGELAGTFQCADSTPFKVRAKLM